MQASLWIGLEALAPAVAMRRINWLFPAVETVHVVAITLVVGTIIVVDVRLLGWASRERRAGDVMRQMLPFTWTSFIIAVISGTLMFISSATSYVDILPFRMKFILMVCAGLNMALFHRYVGNSLRDWDAAPTPPSRARWAAALSLLLWTGIVACGRWVGFSV